MASTRIEPLFAVWLLACNGAEPEPSPTVVSDVVAEVAPAIPTVLTVTWETDVAEIGHVAFGVDGALDRSTVDELEASTSHTATLVGLPPSAEISLQVVSAGASSDVITATTGTLPVSLGELTVEGDGLGRYLAVPLLKGTSSDIVLVDPAGKVVWRYVDDRGPQVFRARVSLDGTGMVYASTLVNGLPSEDSALVRVSWDGATVTVLPVPYLAHDFVELPDGTLVSLAYETRDGVQGNKLVAVAPDGTTTSLWSTWDCFDPVIDAGDDPEHGWTHTNALDYDPVADVFHVGMRNLGTIVEVARDGTCNWAFGNVGGNVEIDGPQFVHEHQFERTTDGLLVFDNDGAPGSESRVLEYTFDPAAGTASLARTISADPPLYSFILGDVHRLDDGDTLVVWGITGVADRITADDQRVGRITTPDQVGFGFAQSLEDPQRPE